MAIIWQVKKPFAKITFGVYMYRILYIGCKLDVLSTQAILFRHNFGG